MTDTVEQPSGKQYDAMFATIHERMAAILAELPPIGKNQKNTQQNFMFRGHDDVLNALNPLLAKHGVIVLPDVLERITDQRTTAKGSVMFEVNLHVRYTFYGAGGDSITASTWGEGTDMGDKATNKAMTMAFKNVLNQAFAISNAENIDSDSKADEPTVKRGKQKPAAEDTSRIDRMRERILEICDTIDTAQNHVGEGLAFKELERLIAWRHDPGGNVEPYSAAKTWDECDEADLEWLGLAVAEFVEQGCPGSLYENNILPF